MLAPFKSRKKELESNKKELKEQIKESSSRIRKQAQKTIFEVKELVGLMNVKY